jgi:uncharacterized protein YndB with AHSA1/START domain
MTATTGLTKDAGWQIGVSRTYPVAPERAWDVLVGEGLPVWLGEGVVLSSDVAPGTPYRTAEGAAGELRSFRPLDRVRLTWRPAGSDHETTVQVVVRPSASGTGTSVRFHQERMKDEAERNAMRDHWREVLDRLEPVLAGDLP